MLKIILPYIMSAITITSMLLAGNKKKAGWIVGLVNQALWLTWIFSIQAWGLLPMTIALVIVYSRNLVKWSKSEGKI